MELILDLDSKAKQSIDSLMSYYNTRNRAEVISKALVLLQIVTHVKKTNGELIARKDNQETKIIIR